MIATEKLSLLAWAGWQLEMPAAWQPLKLTGPPAKGQMIVGDSTCAMFRIQWERNRVPDARAWVTERLRKHGVLPGGTPPGEEHFTACGWAYGVQSEEDKQTTYWYAYSAPAELVLGVTVNGVLAEKLREIVTEQVLPSLRATPVAGDSVWAMYDLRFVIPAGFELTRRHLFAGDVALEFRRKKKEMLMVRQVYPGDLALGRRTLENWLRTYPFHEHRRLQAAKFDGAACRGRKRLGFPLGWVKPRATCAVVAHDQQLNRLLIAEHQSATAADENTCRTAIAHMNESHRENV